MINITKLENGSIAIETEGSPIKYYSNLTNVETVATTSSSISVISSKRTFVLDFDQIDEINGEAKPETIDETVELLATTVFN